MNIFKNICRVIMQIPKYILLALIWIYRKCISPIFPPCCRFVPTCSEYASIAVRRYGFIKGGAMAVKRLSHCHPWHEGGYDPVP